MSVSLLRSGAGLEPPETTALSSTSATTIVTSSENNLRVVESIHLINVDDANDCIVSLHWVNSTPTSSLLWRGEVTAGTTTILDDMPILLDGKGIVRSLTATAAAANDITVTVVTSRQTKQSFT